MYHYALRLDREVATATLSALEHQVIWCVSLLFAIWFFLQRNALLTVINALRATPDHPWIMVSDPFSRTKSGLALKGFELVSCALQRSVNEWTKSNTRGNSEVFAVYAHCCLFSQQLATGSVIDPTIDDNSDVLALQVICLADVEKRYVGRSSHSDLCYCSYLLCCSHLKLLNHFQFSSHLSPRDTLHLLLQAGFMDSAVALGTIT